MACNTLKEILKDCTGNVGGVVKFYINNGDAIDMSTVTFDADDIVDAASLDSNASEFVEFQFNPNTSNYTENVTVDLTTGSTFYDQIITLVLNKRESKKRQSLLLIASGQPPLTVIVKDSNGIYWIFGLEDDKVFLTGNEGGSGTAKSDHNGYTLSFTGQSVTPAYEIEESVVVGLL